MKRTIIITLLLFLASCQDTKTSTTAIAILVDRTDKDIPEPNYKVIQTLLDLEDNPNNGVVLKFQNIGNTDFNPVQSIEIKEGSLLDNSFQRKSDVTEFYKAIGGLIKKENNKNYSFQKSSILYPLIENLKALQEHNGKRVLVLYSDLAEFSKVYNSYQLNNLKSRSPQMVASDINSKIEIPRIENTTLYVIYYPETDVQNDNFKYNLALYKELFKASGLKIRIGIDNQIKY
ncbi:MAG: hypothetical protein J0L86_02650 [Flavobacteriales bacterium]|nr:hypothetical protein [Flavobacteriales bacterium]